MLKTITLNPDIPVTKEKEETLLNNQLSFPSVTSLKSQDLLIQKTEKSARNFASSFLNYKKNFMINSNKKLNTTKKDPFSKLNTLHNLTRYEEGFFSSPCPNLNKRLTLKGSNLKL